MSIVDGQDDAQVFAINVGIDATICNLTLTGGSNDGAGGGLFNQGDLIIANTIFRENSAFFGRGS